MNRVGAAPATSAATVEVRYAFVGAITPSARGRMLALLSDDERERHVRLRAEADRNAYLAAHALLRAELSRHAGVTPEALRFEARADGKPELAAPQLVPRLAFSLTHARGLVACAITRDADVGIDTEDVSRHVSLARLEARVLAARERSALAGLDPDARRRRFFEAWTLREAYAKATGIGMAHTLGTVEFVLARRQVAIRFLAGQADRSSAWSFRVRELLSQHVVSVAVRAPKVRVAWAEVPLATIPGHDRVPRSLRAR